MGSRIVIRDGDGTVMGTGSLEEGVISGLTEEVNLRDRTPGDGPIYPGDALCSFPFAVDLIADAPFYSIVIDDRNELTYSHDELEGLGWELALTLQ
jgi:hypothetical protein